MSLRWAIVILMIASCTLGVWGQGEVRWLESEHDFGTFKEDCGKVTCTMRMVNVGDSALTITRVQSSCGCTAPSYTKDPIEPGDTATISLTYNPAHRPGQFEKDVYIYTNGTPARNRLTIKGKVIAAEITIDKRYPVRAGNLRLETENVPFGEMYRGTSSNAYINAYNASNDTLLVTTHGNKPHVSLIASPDTVAPGEASAIVAHYDNRHAPLWGLNVDTLMVMTESLHNSPTAMSGITPIYVMAQVVEDMRKLTPEQRVKAPVMHLDIDRLVFDNISPVTNTERTFTIANHGQRILNVRRLWCPDAAVTILNAPTTVMRGRSEQVTVAVDPTRLDGTVLNTTLTIMTDDPNNSRVQVHIAGMVKK